MVESPASPDPNGPDSAHSAEVDSLFQEIVHAAPFGILLLDPVNRIVRINGRAMRMLDTGMEIEGRPINDLCYYDTDIPRLTAFISSHERHPLYLSLKATGGEKVQVRIHASQIDTLICLYLEDNAEVLTLEEELHNFQSAINSADDAILLFDRDGMIFYTNPACERQTGLPGEEILGSPIENYWSDVALEDMFQNIWNCIGHAQTWAGELICVRSDLSSFDVEVRITPILSEKESIVGFICIQRDITERKRFEQQLADYSENLERWVEERTLELAKLHDIAQLFHSTNSLSDRLHMVLIAATAGESFGFNRAFLLLVDEKNERLSGAYALGPCSPDEANRIWSRIDHSIGDNPLPEALQTHLDNMDKGDESANRIVQQMATPLSDHSSILVQSIHLERSFIVNGGKADVEFDPSIMEWLGSDQFVVIPLLVQEKPIGVLVADNIITKQPINEEDLKTFDILAAQAALAIAHANAMEKLADKVEERNTAYSELRLSQEKLIEQEKFAVLGQMAATVAHEIRTPLVAIGGFANMLLRKGDPNDPNYPHLKVIRDETLRLEDVINRLLFYARPDTPQLEPGDLSQLLYSILSFLEEEIREKEIQLDLQFVPDLPLIPFDWNLMRQVFINLFQNSIQSMIKQGTLYVTTEVEDQWISVIVRDTGCGIKPEHIDRIFEPFFSTKHQGTGLGLHVTQRIVKSHGGTLQIDSTYQEGTAVYLRLPKNKE